MTQLSAEQTCVIDRADPDRGPFRQRVWWGVASHEPCRAVLAVQMLGIRGFQTYRPLLREHRLSRGRKVEVRAPLFPGYLFVRIESRWYDVRWCPGVRDVLLAGDQPAAVRDNIISEIRSRERDGLVELPKPRGLRRGDQVEIVSGPFHGQLAIVAGMRPRDRVAVLLAMLGGERVVSLRLDDVARACEQYQKF